MKYLPAKFSGEPMLSFSLFYFLGTYRLIQHHAVDAYNVEIYTVVVGIKSHSIHFTYLFDYYTVHTYCYLFYGFYGGLDSLHT